MVASGSKTSTLKDFLADSKSLIGREAPDVPQGISVADWSSIQKFCSALGDVNPLYNDPSIGIGTVYNTLIAPPTFVLSARTPNSGAAYEQKEYGLRRFTIRATAEWNDAIRMGERIVSDLKVADVRSGAKWGNRETAEVDSTATYSTVYGGVLATVTGTVALVPYQLAEPLIQDRDIHVYSDDEIHSLEKDLDAIPPHRGNVPIYWSEVREGDKIPALVKGPVEYNSQELWEVALAQPTTAALGPVAHRQLLERPGRRTVNPTTDWPFLDVEQAFKDLLSASALGFKMPVVRGLHRFALATQVITNWMGDLGFLRKVSLDMPNHFCYGDTMWVSGEVVKKFQERVGDEDYRAVEIKLSGHNQLGQALVDGTAVVYLPEKGFLVGLPIGNPWW